MHYTDADEILKLIRKMPFVRASREVGLMQPATRWLPAGSDIGTDVRGKDGSGCCE